MKVKKLFARLLVITGLIMILSVGYTIFAANTATQGITFSNPVTGEISLDVGAVTFGALDSNHTATANGGSLTVTSNGSWTVSVRGSDFSDGAPTPTTIGIDRLSITKDGGTNYTALATTNTSLTSSSMGASIALGYKIALQNGDPGSANNFTATLTYTIAVN